MSKQRELEGLEKFDAIVDCLKESCFIRAYLRLKLGKEFKERHIEELAIIMTDVHFDDISVFEA